MDFVRSSLFSLSMIPNVVKFGDPNGPGGLLAQFAG